MVAGFSQVSNNRNNALLSMKITLSSLSLTVFRILTVLIDLCLIMTVMSLGTIRPTMNMNAFLVSSVAVITVRTVMVMPI